MCVQIEKNKSIVLGSFVKEVAIKYWFWLFVIVMLVLFKQTFMDCEYLASTSGIYPFPSTSCCMSDFGVQSALILHRSLVPLQATAFIPEIEICNVKPWVSLFLHHFILLTPFQLYTHQGRTVPEIRIHINYQFY